MTATLITPEERPTNLWRDAWRRLKRNRLAVTGLVIIVALVLVAVLGPWLTPYDFLSQNLDARNLTPTLAHPFGTDDLGRDVLSRLIYGARTAFLVALMVTAIALAIGVVLGRDRRVLRRLVRPGADVGDRHDHVGAAAAAGSW